jgi:hypothetical protein
MVRRCPDLESKAGKVAAARVRLGELRLCISPLYLNSSRCFDVVLESPVQKMRGNSRGIFLGTKFLLTICKGIDILSLLDKL